MDFEEAMEWLYHHEVSRPDGWTRGLEHDRGLRTRWGLSERSNPDLDLEQIGSWGEAHPIYRERYWDAVSAEELPECLRLPVFDWAVHSGPRTAAMRLQAALGFQVSDPGRPNHIDGKIGPYTLAAARNAARTDHRGLVRDLLRLRVRDRVAQIRQDPGQLESLGGWWQRLLDVALDYEQ